MSKRAEVLELAILGLLLDQPMHGYEIRKLLNTRLGVFQSLSFGTLYPALRALLNKNLIVEAALVEPPARPLTSKRGRVSYQITAAGKEHFQSLVSDSGPTTWEDETFDVRMAFFARTDPGTRLRILEGRRMRLQERREAARELMLRNRERRDTYTLAMQQHGLDGVEREVRWLEELIDSERESNMTHLLDPDKAPPGAIEAT